mgnify:CR=1 FL=1
MVEFISNNSRYIIEDGFIKRLEKKDKLLEVVFIDKINWIWLLGDYGVLSICKVQLHMNDKIVELFAKDYNQAKDMLETILEEKRKMRN